MAKPSPADLQKAKEAKQKKLLFVLLPFFLVLVAWQGPKMYKQLFAAPAPETAPVTTTAPATTAPTTSAPGTSAAPAGLTESEPPAVAGGDQLASLSRFRARNPFVPLGGATTSPTNGSTVAATSAEIEVNGVSETVTVNGTFPAAEPVFQLVSVSDTGAVVGLTSGSFDSGEGTVQIALGEQVELVADDGATYTVTLASIG